MKWVILTVIITLILTANLAFSGGEGSQDEKDRDNIEHHRDIGNDEPKAPKNP